MVFEYCPKCGEKLDQKEIGDEGLVPFCVSCNKALFSFSYPCVLCIVIDENSNIVLTKGIINGQVSDKYGLVAGYIKEGESAENAAKREIEEEIGLEIYEAVFIKSYCYDKDTLMLGFVCKAKHKTLNISTKELHFAEWFSIIEATRLLRRGSISSNLLTDYLQGVNHNENFTGDE